MDEGRAALTANPAGFLGLRKERELGVGPGFKVQPCPVGRGGTVCVQLCGELKEKISVKVH